MSPNRRIFLNIVATYGRSLYAMILGLFTARWALQALGRTDYGLMGLVGGLSGFVTFFNGLMAMAVGRFYAVNIGKAKILGENGLEECRCWFNTAFTIHTFLPIVLVAIGYPCGIWAVKCFLVIPPDRITDCVWVWRLTCISCFVAMVNVPFQAMYTAKQEIAEMTIYGVVTSTLNAFFLYHMVTTPDKWLVKFVTWSCFLGVCPQLIIAYRAMLKYPECRIRLTYMWDVSRIFEMCKYAYARLVANLSGTLSTQAKSILVNKYMGADYNASMTIGTSLASQAMTLSSSLSGAMWPAIANKAGEGDEEAIKNLCFVTCRIGAVLVLIFAIPLIIEIKEVLRLWLGEPPPFTAEICCTILISTTIQKMTDGYWMAILGKGKDVMYYSHCACVPGFLLAIIAWILFIIGYGMWSVISAITFYTVSLLLIRVYLGKRLMQFSPLHWFSTVFFPITMAGIVSGIVGFLPSLLMSASFVRVVSTTIVSELAFLLLIWWLVLREEEKRYILNKLKYLKEIISQRRTL